MLVSDWDENVEGTDALGDCEVIDGSRRTDMHHLNETKREPGRHTVERQSENNLGGNAENEDEDILLVGDYDANMEEEAGLERMASPVTSPPGSPEVRHSHLQGHMGYRA